MGLLDLLGLRENKDVRELTEQEKIAFFSQYVDILTQYGVPSREERNFRKGMNLIYPSLSGTLNAAYDLKVMFNEGLLE